MNDLVNCSQRLAAPVLEQYISNTQSTVDSDAEHFQAEILEENYSYRVTEDGRTEGNQIHVGRNQGGWLVNEAGYESYEDSQIRQSGSRAEFQPESQQGVQGENRSSHPNGFPTAPHDQYQYPSQAQGYSTYPPRYSLAGTGLINLGKTYTDASMRASQQYPPLPQYSPQPSPMSQTSQFPTPPMSAGQMPYASPPKAATHYQAPIVQQVNMHVRARRTEIKKHYCPTCPKSFLRPSSLDVHMRTHTGAKPFYCRLPGCRRGFGAMGFNVRSNCVRHEKGHIEKGQLEPLQPPLERGVAQPRL